MKIVINKQELEAAVKNICKVINTKNALPILGDIYFKCERKERYNSIQAIGSDSEVWMKYTLPADEMDEDLEFCVDADLLKNALANLPDQPLEIIVQHGNSDFMNMAINHQTGHTIIPIVLADEYPLPLDLDENTLPHICAEVQLLKQPVKRSLYALSIDDPLRPIMNCMYFDKVGDHLNIVASNGHVLIKNEELAEVIKEEMDVSFMMPRKVATILTAIMGELDGEDDMYFYVDDRQVRMIAMNVTLQFRMPDGKFPNYQAVIPESQPYWMTSKRQDIITAIKRVSPFTSSASNMLTLCIKTNSEDPDNDMLTVMGDDYDFSTSATDSLVVKTNLTDDHMSIGVKASSLLDSLSRLAESEVEVRFTDPSRAITISPVPLVKDETITMLIMPMLLNDSDK